MFFTFWHRQVISYIYSSTFWRNFTSQGNFVKQYVLVLLNLKWSICWWTENIATRYVEEIFKVAFWRENFILHIGFMFSLKYFFYSNIYYFLQKLSQMFYNILLFWSQYFCHSFQQLFTHSTQYFLKVLFFLLLSSYQWRK